MAIIRYLARSVSLLNVLLGALLAAILTYALFPLLSVKGPFKPVAATSGQSGGADKAQPVQVPSPSDYAVVAENNLFHPDRKIPAEKKQLPKPELALHGTLITGDVALAYVDDKQAPYSTPGRGKRLRVLRIGDVISGFVLKEIEAQKITLVRNEEIMTVSIDTAKVRIDEGAPKQAAAPSPPQRTGVPPLSTPRTAGQAFSSQRTGLPTVATPPAALPLAASPGTLPTVMPSAPAAAGPTLPQPPRRQIRIPTQQ
jgi:hypothetical protein